MGNTMAPHMCRKDAGATAAVTARGRRRPKSFGTEVPVPAAPDAAPRKHQRGDVELELEQQQQDETTARVGPGRSRARAGPGVSWAEGVGADDDGDDDAAVGKGKQASAAAAVVTVKIVLKRKDAEALVARLSARERKGRLAELKGEFRAGDCVGGASPAPCRDAWKPMLAPINEN